MLVDDHAMVRHGLASFLQVFDDLILVGEAADGEAAMRLCEQIQPDVVLMDMVMPHVDGVTATRHIRQRFPTVQVLALSGFEVATLIRQALQAGAIGYLLKDVSALTLAEAIRAAHKGRGTLSPAASQELVNAVNQPSLVDRHLTGREQAVLILLVDGLNNTEIATKLFVKPSTIKSHVSHILAKLEVTSRTEAVAFAVRHRLVE